MTQKLGSKMKKNIKFLLKKIITKPTPKQAKQAKAITSQAKPIPNQTNYKPSQAHYKPSQAKSTTSILEQIFLRPQ